MNKVRAFRHEKKPEWGQGVLTEERSDRLHLVFSDGVTRILLKGAPGLVEVPPDPAAKATELARGKDQKKQQQSSLTKMKPSSLIKAFRIAMRDALAQAKSTAGYPDDTLIEMQKGLSRITADHARFLNTRPEVVRKASADTARELAKVGVEAIFEELAERLDGASGDWRYTRAFQDPSEAAENVRALLPYVLKALKLDQRELDALEALLTLEDLKPDDVYER